MKIKIMALSLVLVAALFPGRTARAQDPDVMRERVIGGAFKGFAEAVLAVTDLEKEKKKFVGQVRDMDDQRFAAQYARYWRLMKEWPLPVRLKYGVSDHMTRDQLAVQIQTLTKDDVHSLIQNLPDRVVAREFDRRLKRMGKQLQQATLPQQVRAVWEKVDARVRQLQGDKKPLLPENRPEGSGHAEKGP